MWQPTGTVFPLELIDIIIDFTHTDRRTLANCSLVSKTWLPTSRLHLFEHVTLTRANFVTFLVLFSSTHCSILPYIHAVTVFGFDWKSFQAVFKILAILKQLDTLRFQEIVFDLAGPSIPPCHKVKTLDMFAVSFRKFTHLTEVVALFPAIERLHIYNSKWQSNPRENLVPAPSTLCAVDVGLSSKEPIFDWLVGSASTLKTLKVDLSYAHDICAAMQYLRSLGPSLEHLQLALYLRKWRSKDLRELDLTHSTHLLSLHLHLDAWQSTVCISTLLWKIQSSKITDLILDIRGDIKTVFPTMASQQGIESALKAPQFVSLQRVQILRDGRQLAGKEFDLVRGLFPFCEKHGLLR